MSNRTLLEILEDVLVDDGERQFDSRSVFSVPIYSADSILTDLRRELVDERGARRQLEETILFLRIENDRLRRDLRNAGHSPSRPIVAEPDCLADAGSAASPKSGREEKVSLRKTLHVMCRIAWYAIRHPLTEGIINIRTGKVRPKQHGE